MDEITKRLDNIEKEIKQSREMNKSALDAISKSTKETEVLSDTLTTVLDNFRGFNATVKFVRGILITIGLLWLIFKDLIMKTIT